MSVYDPMAGKQSMSPVGVAQPPNMKTMGGTYKPTPPPSTTFYKNAPGATQAAPVGPAPNPVTPPPPPPAPAPAPVNPSAPPAQGGAPRLPRAFQGGNRSTRHFIAGPGSPNAAYTPGVHLDNATRGYNSGYRGTFRNQPTERPAWAQKATTAAPAPAAVPPPPPVVGGNAPNPHGGAGQPAPGSWGGQTGVPTTVAQGGLLWAPGTVLTPMQAQEEASYVNNAKSQIMSGNWRPYLTSTNTTIKNLAQAAQQTATAANRPVAPVAAGGHRWTWEQAHAAWDKNKMGPKTFRGPGGKPVATAEWRAFLQKHGVI